MNAYTHSDEVRFRIVEPSDHRNPQQQAWIRAKFLISHPPRPYIKNHINGPMVQMREYLMVKRKMVLVLAHDGLTAECDRHRSLNWPGNSF